MMLTSLHPDPYKPFYILKRLQDSWYHDIHNKLHEIHSLLGKTPCVYGQHLQERMLLTRCRIVHIIFTHSYFCIAVFHLVVMGICQVIIRLT
jgi:hypothetical protein